MSKEEIIKEVISILETSDYVDLAEDLYDGLKQIKREITYSTIHDFLWALESSTVIDVDGKVAECANKIKPLLVYMTIDDAYKNYVNKTKFPGGDTVPKIEFMYHDSAILTQEEFINKCKTDTEFSEKWGLKIEERELGLEERAQWLQDNTEWELLVGNLDHDHIREVVEEEAPTKLITITHNDKTIESYE
jgi:hypothetical protein